VGYRKPYALSLQDEQVEIHNCADEQMVQSVKNTKGFCSRVSLSLTL
jgi:hypothetical protein